MTPPTFQIGQEVEVTGPDINGKMDWIGKRFVVERSRACEKYYTAFHVPLFPASSLRLVEELKIGDWAEVVGPCGDYYCTRPDDPEIIRIRGKNDRGYFYGKDTGRPGYPDTSLRKLTPEEIKQQTRPCTKEDGCGYVAKCDWCNKDLGKCAIGGNGEHYCSVSCSVMAEDHKKLAAIEKRLDFVEKFQREQAEATQYRRNMLWMAGP